MQKNNFEQVIQDVVAKDTRFGLNSYHFVRDALDYTIKMQKKSHSANRHVTGPELLEGIRQFTLREFGPMSKFVLNEWGIFNCHDFGQIVFNLVSHGVLGKSESDKVEDFSETYTFEEAFLKPFLPTPAATPVRSRKKKSTTARRVKPDKNVPSKSSPAE